VSGGGTGVFVSDGRHWPPEVPASDHLADVVAAGQAADPYPGYDDYRPDAATAAIALEYLRVAKPALFHIGLGDTDEYGHRGLYASYLDAMRRADSLVGAVADVLATMGDDGARTTVIVTPDHGRNADFRDHGAFHPESARTFLVAFGPRVVRRGIGCPTRDITLADIAPTVRVLMGLPRDTAAGAGTPIELITQEPLQ
jgi:phosphopentomutase